MSEEAKDGAVNPLDAEYRIAEANYRSYMRARDSGHLKYMQEALKHDKFYLGDQWDEQDLKKLQASRRPALTINQILSNVNTIHGEHIQNRADFAFRPKRNATEGQAHVWNKLFEHITDANKYQYVEGLVFLDGLIMDRGWFDVRLDFSDNLQGEVRITSVDPLEVMPDPDAKELDPDTWNEVTRSRWMTVNDIELHYGKDKADKVRARAMSDPNTLFGPDSIKWEEDRRFGDTNTYVDPDSDSRTVKSIRVIERQHKQLYNCRFFVDNVTGDIRQIPDSISEARAEAMALEANMSIIRRMAKKIRWTVTADSVVLHDAWSPYKHFTLVPFFPYFRRGRPMGIVKNLISPQEQLNKLESQTLHTINSTANGGYYVEEGSLVNLTPEELEKRGAETGIVIVYRRGGEVPQKIQPNQIPTGLDRMGSKAMLSLREIAGTASLLGDDSPEVSGVALARSQSRGLAQMQPIFDSLNHTRRILAEVVMAMVQRHYTETRIVQVTNWEGMEPQIETMVINGVTPEGQIMNDVTTGEYTVVVSNQPQRDTFMDSQFAEAVQLREAGIMIPDHHVINFSHLEHKQQIAEEVKQMMGMGEQTPEQQQMAAMMQEIQIRTMLAQLGELEAKAANLQSAAQLNMAKAEQAASAPEMEGQKAFMEAQAQIRDMRFELEKLLLEHQNKLQLAGVHTGAKNQLTRYTTVAKRALEEKRMRVDLAKTLMKPVGRPNRD